MCHAVDNYLAIVNAEKAIWGGCTVSGKHYTWLPMKHALTHAEKPPLPLFYICAPQIKTNLMVKLCQTLYFEFLAVFMSGGVIYYLI